MEPVIRLGVVGTGFISHHFVRALGRHPAFMLSRVLTRRRIETCREYPRPDALTNSLQELVEHSDVILECSGDAVHATDVVAEATSAGLPVVTMNAEFHVTTGSYFVGKGLVTEAEGDQPGCQAALREEVLELGFEPLVYGSMKGYLKHNPTEDEMLYWAERQGISLPMVVASTDGTKVQVEQTLVANGCGAGIAAPGLLGPAEDDLEAGAVILAEQAEALGEPIADYVLSAKLPHGVFIVGRYDEHLQPVLRYLKLGDGPFYTIIRNNIFVHLEIMKTVKRVMQQGRGLLDNSARPTVSVAAVAKRPIARGERIPTGIGSFDVRGIAVRIQDHERHVPIGLLHEAVVTTDLDPGQMLTFADVELPDSLALGAWRTIAGRLASVPRF